MILKDSESTQKSIQQEAEKLQGIFQYFKDSYTADKEAFAASQQEYEAIRCGMGGNAAGEAEALQVQLTNAKRDAMQANTEIEQATLQLTRFQAQLKEKQQELNSNAVDYQRENTNVATLEKKVASLERALRKLNYSEERLDDLRNEGHILRNAIGSAQERIERFQVQNPCASFQYTDPETDFYRRRVKGVVCRLFDLKNREAATAIEIVAGKKLYNVVVNAETTGSKLLQHGNLQNSTTFIPLNRIQGKTIPWATIKLAQALVGKENVQPALSLISYDERLLRVMEFVFGNVFICKDYNVARQVAGNDHIRCKCVTLDGVTVYPSGELGGREGPISVVPILLQLEEIKQLEIQLQSKEAELKTTEDEIKQMSATQEEWTSMKRRLELRQGKLGVDTKCLHQTTHQQQQEEIDDIKQNIADLTEKVKSCNKIEAKSNSKVKELESKMKDVKGHQDRLLKQAEKEMKRLQNKADNSRKKWKDCEEEYVTLNLEISKLKKRHAELKKIHSVLKKEHAKLQEDCVEFQNGSVELKEILVKLQQEYNAIAERNKEMQKKIHEKEKLLAQVSEFELEIKKQNLEIIQLQDTLKAAKNREAEYSKKIEKMDGKYLKAAQELDDAGAHELEEQIRYTEDKLKRTVNSKAESMFGHEETRCNKLLNEKITLEREKQKLLVVMKDLDKKKQDAMLAWEQVSRNFGSIFGTLFPGSNAKLQVPSGQSVLQGLEVKIFYDGVWQSFTGLTRSKRSVAALSLILAIWLLEPAPLYMLDGIDFDLDAKTTRKLLKMLKTRFKQSQFIMASLKDGIFSDAIVFNTKHKDGVSTVARRIPSASSPP